MKDEIEVVALIPAICSDLIGCWLGDAALLSRTIEKVVRIREVDRIILLSEDVNAAGVNWVEKHKDPRLLDITFSKGILDRKKPIVSCCEAFYAGCTRYDREHLRGKVIIAINPMYPLLEQSTIEKVLQTQLEDLKRIVYTSNGKYSMCRLMNVDGLALMELPNYCDAVVAYIGKDTTTSPHFHVIGGRARDIWGVPLLPRETINVDSADGWDVAEVLCSGFTM